MKRIKKLILSQLLVIAMLVGVISPVTVSAATPISTIEFTGTQPYSLNVGKTKKLSPRVTPSGATKDFTWSSSNSSVASVDDTGIVTAKGPGSATITVRSRNSSASAQARFSVKAPLQSISLNENAIVLPRAGSTYKLYVSYAPSNTTDDKTVTWSSSNTSIATVDGSGNVTLKQEGKSATIRAKVGGKSASCKVTGASPLQSISLSSTSVSLASGKTKKLSVKYTPSNTTDNKTATWSSSNSKIASVDSTGKITANGPGKATITAKVGSKTANCAISVTAALQSISLNKSTIKGTKGDTAQLSVKYSPSNTTDNKTVTWSSSNTSIATVNKSGVVTIKGTIGSATITAKVGTKTAKCKVELNTTGAIKYNGNVVYFKNGKQASFNDIASYKGKLYKFRGGRIDTSFTGIAKCKEDKKSYWVTKAGKAVDTSKSGIYKITTNGKTKTYKIKKGAVDVKYTGAFKYDKKVYYVNKGIVNTKYKGTAKDANGVKYKFTNGVGKKA